MMRTSELHQPPVARRAKGMVREGLRYVRRVPDLRVPLVMMTVVGTLTFNFSVVIPLFVEKTLHGNDGTYTLLYSVLSLGSLAGALVAAHRRAIGVRTIVVASLAFGAAMLMFASAPNLASSFPFALLVGFASVAFMTGSSAVVQLRSAPTMRGRVLALQAIVFIGSTPVGGPVLGAVCDRYGARAGLILGGVAALAAGAWGYRATRRLAASGTTTVDTVEALEAEATEMQVA
jgi:MFS family permease